MALSIVRVTNLTSSSMKILFTDDLDENIGIENVSITSTLDTIADTEITYALAENDVLTIKFRPIFEAVKYLVTFSSTTGRPFQTVNGSRITEDGSRNTIYIIGPGEENSEIRDNMIDLATDVYEIEEQSVCRDLVSSEAKQIQKCADEIDTITSANYISILVEDEKMTRGSGATDKFLNGGVYEVLRVAENPSGTNVYTYLQFDSTRKGYFETRSDIITNPIIEGLTEDPISLQGVDVINEEVSDDSDQNNFFSGLKIKVANGPVTQLISVLLKRNGVYTVYDTTTFGYTLKNNEYDTSLASKNVNLDDREIELSSSSITGTTGGFLTPQAGDTLYVSYIYKKLGRSVDEETVVLSSLERIIREMAPAITTKFTLENAPIVLSSDETPSTGGITFYNTQVVDGEPAFTTDHPALLHEIEFDVSKLPARPGDYAVNYSTGEVYVFGEDANNTGTGNSPPAATYYYRKIYTKDIDYTYDIDTSELAIKSTRDLEDIEAKISFEYEDVFTPDSDYKVSSHVEVLSERVNNSLSSDFMIDTHNSPITNVFRIFNETTGEIYTLDRFNDTTITFTGRQAPRQKDITRERASFLKIPQEILYVSDELTNSYGFRIFKIDLENSGIISASGNFIGANFDTSIIFSDTSIFVSERYYDSDLLTDYVDNINRIQNAGEYVVDYENGVIYVAVSSDQNTDVGDISYNCKKIDTKNSHILKANNIYKSINSSTANTETYAVGDVEDETIDVINLESVGQRFIGDSVYRTLIVGTIQSGDDGVTTESSKYFSTYSGIFDSTYIGKTIRVGSADQTPVEDKTIVTIVNTHQIIVDSDFSTSDEGRVWTVMDLSLSADKTIALDHDITFIKDIYLVEQLGTVIFSELDGYYDVDNDTFSGNVITLSDYSQLSVGDSIIVNYNYGNIYVDYRYLQDELLVSYEYGNNSLDWSISDSLYSGDEYYVTYKYGALRDSLQANFGALTQIPQLTSLSTNIDRETYRSIVGGTIQSFVKGPTIPAIKNLVKSFTGVDPEIKELAFSNWVLGRDPLHNQEVKATNYSYDSGRFGKGLLIEDDSVVKIPAVSHLGLKEGTIETWIKPNWSGVANDATLTFDIQLDGYDIDVSKVYIGFSNTNPTEIPFSISIDDDYVSGEPYYIDDDTYVGYFIWFDEFNKKWNIRWKDDKLVDHDFTGTIETTGEFYEVEKPYTSDGYVLNEITDFTTTYIKKIEFEAHIDGYDTTATTNPTATAMDGIAFKSGDLHYIFDMAEKENANRMSIFKDAQGFLNFRVIDNAVNNGESAKICNISKDITDWKANENNHVAVSWKLNSDDERDELHLFLNGQEVDNLYKYGGHPSARETTFRDAGEELAMDGAVRPIVGGFDGRTTMGTNLFVSLDVDFDEEGIIIGDKLYILDETADGTSTPNLGTAYTITGVGGGNLTVNRNFTLTMSDITFSVNQATIEIDTPVNFQEFVVVVRDTSGNDTELKGVDANDPDYSVSRSGTKQYLSVNNGVNVSDDIVVKTLGLMFERCREKTYVYKTTDEIRTNSTEPTDLHDVDITKIILNRTSIEDDGYVGIMSTIVGPGFVTNLQGYFTDFASKTSNVDSGRKLVIYLSGGNIDYTTVYNYITISGSTFSGVDQETIAFTSNGYYTTTEYWRTISDITISVTPIDSSEAAGLIEIKENKPITESENNGDYAEVVDYYNGIYKLEMYGSGGMTFNIERAWYEVDYTTYLKINVDAMPDYLYIGSAFDETGQLEGVIDGFRILNTALTDVRIGEDPTSVDHSITADYNSITELEANTDTLLMLNFNEELTDAANIYDRYDEGFEIAESVNDYFDKAIKFSDNKPYILSNKTSAFHNDEGTIEFWVNSLDDSKEDPNYRYFIDMSTTVEEELTSTNNATVVLSQRASSIDSVRLVSDVNNNGVNYYVGGSLSTADYKTITLGTALPLQTISVKVIYTPASSNGDRVSIYRDPDGRLNFFMRASEVEHQISVRIDWQRHTWHRVMVMWTTNSTDNEDRLRLFVDGLERGTIKYGTGLIYGTGVIYGQEDVIPGSNRYIVDNIDLTDTFPRIFIGSDVYRANGARALMDNIRFSNIERLESIKITSTDTEDTNYISNTELVNPVVEDTYTTEILNFNKTDTLVDDFSTLLNAERGIFRWECKVIDSFHKVKGNEYLEKLLEELLDKLKPAHTEIFLEIVE